jgi:hypothetical protein
VSPGRKRATPRQGSRRAGNSLEAGSTSVTDTLLDEALDAAAIADQIEMDRLGVDTLKRHAYPCELDAIGLPFIPDTYGVRIERITRDRHAKGIHQPRNGEWKLIALGAAIFPPGRLDQMVNEANA